MTRVIMALTVAALLSPAVRAGDGPAEAQGSKPERILALKFIDGKIGEREFSDAYDPEVDRFVHSPEFAAHLKARGLELEELFPFLRGGMLSYWNRNASADFQAKGPDFGGWLVYAEAHKLADKLKADGPARASGDWKTIREVLTMRKRLELELAKLSTPGPVLDPNADRYVGKEEVDRPAAASVLQAVLLAKARELEADGE